LLAGAFPPAAAGFVPVGLDAASRGGGALRVKRSRLMPAPSPAASPIPHLLPEGPALALSAMAAAAAGAAPAQQLEEGPAADGDDSDDGGRSKKRPATKLLTRPLGQGCLECGATQTPVWRTGPRGPKTLCNRCGVRYSKMCRRNK
jgi:hypothetical protein